MPNSKDFNHFDYNPTDIHIERSMFNMDHSVKFSCNVGEVIPFDVVECLPGDTWSVDTSKVVRLQPLVTPIMDEVIQDIFWFFCPNRLVWNKWTAFCGENNESPWAPTVEYNIPRIYPPKDSNNNPVGFDVGTIADYMGIPPKDTLLAGGVNALPLRAYALICDQWFRSEALMNPVNVSVDSQNRYGSNGNDQTIDIELGGKPFIACKYFDYFTASLPSPQRGEAANVFPNKVWAPVVSYNNAAIKSNYGVEHPFTRGNSGSEWYVQGIPELSIISGSSASESSFSSITGKRHLFSNDGVFSYGANSPDDTISSSKVVFDNLYSRLDLANFNINDLRSAFAVQRYLEKSARYGGRYIEFIKGFFGIDSPDARLQRTEYLGGSRISLNINSVEQTSATQAGSTPQGNVAGMSVTADINSDFSYSCTEHGYIIGVSVLRYHHSYQQGLNKMWLRDYFEDFYLPTFAFLGEQPVYREEIYSANVYAQQRRKQIFGYQERWSEYRYLPNRVAGEMRTVASNSLDVWHLADYYASYPTLSPEWIREDKSMLDRCLAVTSAVSNQAICDFYIKCNVARALPLYSIPGLIDHY